RRTKWGSSPASPPSWPMAPSGSPRSMMPPNGSRCPRRRAGWPGPGSAGPSTTSCSSSPGAPPARWRMSCTWRFRGPGADAVLARRIIPCLDVAAGRVVKGVHFESLRDAGDPVEQAARYDAEGADELVFLDISASHEARETLLEIVSRVAD